MSDFYSPTFFHLSVGWGERVRWQGETHAHLWSLQRQSEPPSPRQLAGHALSVQTVGSEDLRDAALLGSRLRQFTFALPDMQRDADALLQTGRLSERAGENMGSWSEWQGIISLSRSEWWKVNFNRIKVRMKRVMVLITHRYKRNFVYNMTRGHERVLKVISISQNRRQYTEQLIY